MSDTTIPNNLPRRRASDGFTTTEKVVGAWCVVLAAYEIYLVITGQQLITQAMVSLTKKYPAIPFAFGFLCAHFWWNAQAEQEGRTVVQYDETAGSVL